MCTSMGNDCPCDPEGLKIKEKSGVSNHAGLYCILWLIFLAMPPRMVFIVSGMAFVLVFCILQMSMCAIRFR